VVAVLPFQNLTGDPGQEYLCDGLTEEMIALLGSTASSGLDVIARTSAMHYKNTTKRADEIARELGVAYVLETSLRRIGNRVRVTAQLIEAQTQGHVWAEQYERDALDLLAKSPSLSHGARCRALGCRSGTATPGGRDTRTMQGPTSTISVAAITGRKTRSTDF
jgi:TolB-like protein